jgi:uncharacterized protein YydD (DUF2326 family)
MAYKVPVENYVRSPQPALPESQLKYLQEELRKLERVLTTVSAALKESEERLSDAEAQLSSSGTVRVIE